MNRLKNSVNPSRKTVFLAAVVLAFGFGTARVAQAQDGVKPSLHMVSAGVSDYLDIPRLFCAHKDALDMARVYEEQEGKLFNKVNVTRLINTDATVANIQQALLALQGKAKAEDYVIVFMAGHGGKTGHPEYGYCAFDKDITWTQIQSALSNVPCKIVVILDTCEAGAVTQGRNMVIFSSTQAHQMADEEQHHNGNGFFTKSLLEALKGQADQDGDRTVTLDEANKYVGPRLQQISFGKQTPTLMHPMTISNTLPLAKLFNNGAVNPNPPVPFKSSGPLPGFGRTYRLGGLRALRTAPVLAPGLLPGI
jgi:uncharacterized caspase-like protein